MKKPLFCANDRIFYDEDLKQTMQRLGIKEGDSLCVHSELFGFGKAMASKNELLDIILQSFLQVLGQNGTLIMPTFTYSFCKKQAYDKNLSKSTMGVLSEYFRKQKGVKRNDDPIFSFAVFGAKQDEFLRQSTSCFGENSVYDMLYKNEGKILLFGCYEAGYTFTHYVEERALISYRFFKKFSGELIDERGQTHQKSIEYFVRRLELKLNLDARKQINFLKQSHNFKELAFANSRLICIEAKPYCDELLKEFKKNEYCLVRKEND